MHVTHLVLEKLPIMPPIHVLIIYVVAAVHSDDPCNGCYIQITDRDNGTIIEYMIIKILVVSGERHNMAATFYDFHNEKTS